MKKQLPKKNEIDYQALWKAVIVQALVDSCCNIENRYFADAKKREKLYNKRDADDFLKSNLFEIFCCFANLDPNFVKANKEKIAERVKKSKLR